MDSTTYQCSCVLPCAFISECQTYKSDLSDQYSKLELSDNSPTETPGIPKANHPIHTFPDQYTSLTTESLPASSSNPLVVLSCPSPVSEIYLTDAEAEIEELQGKEEYIIEKYHEVFDLLEKKYMQLERELKQETGNPFEESVVRAVMSSVREYMGMNDLAMVEGRRVLWEGDGGFELEEIEDSEGGEVEGLGEEDMDGFEVEEITGESDSGREELGAEL